MSDKPAEEQEPITFTEDQIEAIRKGFAGFESGQKGIPLDEARARAKKLAQEWLSKNAGQSASA